MNSCLNCGKQCKNKFCSRHCSASFNTKRRWKNIEYKDMVMKRMKGKLKGRSKSKEHIEKIRRTIIEQYQHGRVAWNKNKTKETNSIVKAISENKERNSKIREATIKRMNSLPPDERSKRSNNLSEKLRKNGTYLKTSKRMKENNPMWNVESLKKAVGYHGINKCEKKILNYTKNNFNYVGDGSVIFIFKDGKSKKGDFISNNGKKVIEHLGIRWHGVYKNGKYYKDNNLEEYLLTSYKDIGIDCLCIWETDLISNDTIKKINHFIGGR